jgi:steroid delta-isomerase-like uncharacterized protein
MRTRISYFALPILVLLAACGGHDAGNDAHAKAHADMMAADSATKAHVAAQEATVSAIMEVINGGSVDALDNLLTADFVDHEQDPAVTTTGIQGAKDMFTLLRTAYPDFKQETVAMSTSGNLTFMHYRMTGTNTGPWGDMPATGKNTDIMGVDVFRFQDGKVAEHWGYMEQMKMMTQLGLMPDPGAEAK